MGEAILKWQIELRRAAKRYRLNELLCFTHATEKYHRINRVRNNKIYVALEQSLMFQTNVLWDKKLVSCEALMLVDVELIEKRLSIHRKLLAPNKDGDGTAKLSTNRKEECR